MNATLRRIPSLALFFLLSTGCESVDDSSEQTPGDSVLVAEEREDPPRPNQTPEPTTPDCADRAIPVVVSVTNSRPTFQPFDGWYQLVLPSAYGEALADYSEDFKTWGKECYSSGLLDYVEYSFDEQQAMFGVIDDFNSDGVLDVALQGTPGEKGTAFLVLLSNPSGIEAIELSADTFVLREGVLVGFLLREPAGEKRGLAFPDSAATELVPVTVTIPNPGFHLIAWGKASVLYWYEDGEFHRLATSD